MSSHPRLIRKDSSSTGGQCAAVAEAAPGTTVLPASGPPDGYRAGDRRAGYYVVGVPVDRSVLDGVTDVADHEQVVWVPANIVDGQ
jgi:hypothetical protein